jgi:hypothetical protein
MNYPVHLEGYLTCIHEPATGLYPEPDESSPQPHTLFSSDSSFTSTSIKRSFTSKCSILWGVPGRSHNQ